MKYTIAKKDQLADQFFYIGLEPEKSLDAITAGQFVMVRCGDSIDPYLRRPMSVADFRPDGSYIGLLVQDVGRGTNILSQKEVDDTLDVTGPFGRGFEVLEDESVLWIVAGGTGVAPFIGLVESLHEEKKRKITIFIGARNEESLLFEDRFRRNGLTVISATEDGSMGYKGLVTEPMRQALEGVDRPDAILTCGPAPMMRAVAKVAEEQKIPCQVSLENHMACGFGACLGCVTKRKTKGDYVAVCKKGPVFDSTEVEF